jgi:hypothetical protein
MQRVIPILVLLAFLVACTGDSKKQRSWTGGGQDSSANNGTPSGQPSLGTRDNDKHRHTENLTKPSTPTPIPQAGGTNSSAQEASSSGPTSQSTTAKNSSSPQTKCK